MEQTSYPPTDGKILRSLREGAGVSQDDVAEQFDPRTTRQRVSRMERDGQMVPYVDAVQYRAALDAAVVAKTSRVA